MAATKTFLGNEFVSAGWIPRVVSRQAAGTAQGWVRIPSAAAQRLLVDTARLVADLAVGSTPRVVWTSGGNELLVHTDSLALTCNVGIVRVAMTVECDQTDGPVTVTVPFAVGTDTDVRGLLMATYDTVTGPTAVVAAWSEALTAFAWEAVLTLAQRVAGAVGKDSAGRPLVPVALGAVQGTFLVRPMARHG